MTVFLIIAFWIWGVGAVKYNHSDSYFNKELVPLFFVAGCVVLVAGSIILGVLNGYIT